MKANVLDYLSEGADNAQTSFELSVLTGLSRREIAQQVHDLRIAGELICSDVRGYWIAEDVDDILVFFRNMRSRQQEIRKATEAAKKELWAKGMDF